MFAFHKAVAITFFMSCSGESQEEHLGTGGTEEEQEEHRRNSRLSATGVNSDIKASCPSDFDFRDLGRCHGSIFGIS